MISTPNPIGQMVSDPSHMSVLMTDHDPHFGMVLVDSNRSALHACSSFCAGTSPFVALVGPSGWGKTQLLRNTAERLGVQLEHKSEAASVHRRLDPVKRISNVPHLILDDAEDFMPRLKDRQELRAVIEHRIRTNRPTLLAFSTSQPIRGLKALLKGPLWRVEDISQPSCFEKRQIVARIAERENAQLSQTLVNVMASKSGGNGTTLVAAIQRLLLVQPDWTTPDSQLRALGVLKPYLQGQTGWDVRDHIHETTRRFAEHQRCFASEEVDDMALFFMRTSVGISEKEVADFFGYEPGFSHSKLQTATLKSRNGMADYYADCRQYLIDSLEWL